MGRLPAPLAHLPKPENPHAFMRSTARFAAVVCHASLPYLRIMFQVSKETLAMPVLPQSPEPHAELFRSMFQVSKETLAMPVLPQSPEPHAELYGAVFGGSAANSHSRPVLGVLFPVVSGPLSRPM